MKEMEKDLQWIVTKIDGKIASVSLDYRAFSDLMKRIVEIPAREIDEITCRKISTVQLLQLSDTLTLDDLKLVGTPFQVYVWQQLFNLTHGEDSHPELMSYATFAKRIGKATAVRQVAHAIALNPICFIVPCHLVIPKESMERLMGIERENGLFKWKALYIVDEKIDYGEYICGRDVKRMLIRKQLYKL